MALTEEQKEIALRIAEQFRASVMDRRVYFGMGADDLFFVIERFLAALPKPEAVDVMFENTETDEWHKKTLYTESPIAPPASEQKPFGYLCNWGKAQRDALLKSLEEALECGEDGDWQSARRVLVTAIASAKGGAE